MKYYFTLICSIFALSVSAQTTLLTENFEGVTHAFLTGLNVAENNSVSTGQNFWIVNNVFFGGTVNGNVCGIPYTANVGNNNQQPGSITNSPESSNLHIMSNDGLSNFVSNNHYKPIISGLCVPSENYFARTSGDINCAGYSNITLSFWWICAGSADSYGEVFYSTNSGTNWTLLTTPQTSYSNNANWQQVTTTIPALANQANVRIGFRFVNTAGVSTPADPGFGIDEVLITGTPSVPNITSDPQNVGICGTTGSASFTVSAQNATNFQWQENSGLGFNNLSNNSPYSGVTTPTLNISPVNASFNGNQYRCIVSNTNGSDTTLAATLNITPTPNIQVNATPNPAAAGVPITFTATGGNIGDTYLWDFCDGGSANTAIATHTYSSETVYTNCPCVYVATTAGCVDTACIGTLTIANLGTENNVGNAYQIYPNPATDNLTIDGLVNNESIRIADMTGRVIWSGKPNGNSIAVNNFAKGTYIITIVDEAGAVLQKQQFIKM